MSLVQLRTFIEVYRQGSLSEAARTLGTSQPAVSQQIRSLEGQIGRPLFVRSARGAEPTTVGRDLANSIGNSLDDAEAALASLRARSTAVSGTVHIAGPAEYLSERFAASLSQIASNGISVRLHTGGKAAIYRMLADELVDLAITASRPDDRRLDCAPLDTETLVAVAAPKIARQLAANSNLSDALTRTPCIAYDEDRPLLRDWCDENGIDPTSSPLFAVAPDLRLIRSLTEQGGCWSVLPDYLCRDSIYEADR